MCTSLSISSWQWYRLLMNITHFSVPATDSQSLKLCLLFMYTNLCDFYMIFHEHALCASPFWRKILVTPLQEVKDQSHRTPKFDLETWWKHHSGLLRSSWFSVSVEKYLTHIIERHCGMAVYLESNEVEPKVPTWFALRSER